MLRHPAQNTLFCSIYPGGLNVFLKLSYRVITAQVFLSNLEEALLTSMKYLRTLCFQVTQMETYKSSLCARLDGAFNMSLLDHIEYIRLKHSNKYIKLYVTRGVCVV